MSFLNPIFLFGLLAAAIPLIIYMIRLHQREQLAFPTIAFLQQLKSSTLKKLKIKQNLLLALRILALLTLGLALARPVLTGHKTGFLRSPMPVLYGFLIDNSPSMNQINKHGPYLNQEKQAVRQIVLNARRQDRFVLMKTNGKEIVTDVLSGGRMLNDLDHITIENRGIYLGSRLTAMSNFMNKHKKNYRQALFWFTDGQRSMLDSLSLSKSKKTDFSLQTWTVIKVGSGHSDNVAVTDIRFPGRNQSIGNNIKVSASVRNFGDHGVQNEYVSLVSKGSVLGQYPLKLNPHEQKNFIFNMPTGKDTMVRGEIKIDGDPFTFDNKRYFALNLSKSNKILVVNGKNPDAYFHSALSAISAGDTTIQADYINKAQWNNNNLRQYDAIVVNGLEEIPSFMANDLNRAVKEGKGLIFLPSGKGDINTYNSFLKVVHAGKFDGFRGEFGNFSEVARIQKPDNNITPLFSGLFEKKTKALQYPALYYYFLMNLSNNNGAVVLMRSNLNDPLLTGTDYGRGHILVSAIGLTPEWSALPASALFAPLIYRMILYVTNKTENSHNNIILGKPFRWLLPFKVSEAEIRVNGKIIRPELQDTRDGTLLLCDNSDWEPGWAEIDASNEKKIFSVNQNIMESDFTTLNKKALQDTLEQDGLRNRTLELDTMGPEEAGRYIESNTSGNEIWNLFVWAGFLLLLAETVVSRWYRIEKA